MFGSLLIGIILGCIAITIVFASSVFKGGKLFLFGILAYVLIFIFVVSNIKSNHIVFIMGYVCATIIEVILIRNYYSPSRNKKQTHSTPKIEKLYINHCWNCGHSIDSRKDKLCPKCHKHYICSNCGKCWCDDPKNGDLMSDTKKKTFDEKNIKLDSDLILLNSLVDKLYYFVITNRPSNNMYPSNIFHDIERNTRLLGTLINKERDDLLNYYDYRNFCDSIAVFLSYCDMIGNDLYIFRANVIPGLDNNIKRLYSLIMSDNK